MSRIVQRAFRQLPDETDDEQGTSWRTSFFFQVMDNLSSVICHLSFVICNALRTRLFAKRLLLAPVLLGRTAVEATEMAAEMGLVGKA